MSIVLDGTTGVTTPGLSSTGTITPGQTTGIVGTTTNNSAQAGSVGEYVSSYISTYANYPATGVFGEATSISLTAGDWDISYVIFCTGSGSSNWAEAISWIGTAAGNNTTGLQGGDNTVDDAWARSVTAVGAVNQTIPAWRASISTTTTYYLKIYADYTSGAAPIFKCRLSARRVR